LRHNTLSWLPSDGFWHDIAHVLGGFQVVPLTTGLVLDEPTTLQVGCVATQKNTVSSQPTTITAIQVESVTRIPT
jgi:hypothetical protein